MKKLMRVSAVVTLLLCFLLVGCGNTDKDKEINPVVITVSGAAEGVNLEKYMTDMQQDGDLTFVIDKGMITSINGINNTTNTYWMLYTDDAANSNTEWGTYEHNGKTLGSATLGANTLVVKNGSTYIWVYQTF